MRMEKWKRHLWLAMARSLVSTSQLIGVPPAGKYFTGYRLSPKNSIPTDYLVLKVAIEVAAVF